MKATLSYDYKNDHRYEPRYFYLENQSFGSSWYLKIEKKPGRFYNYLGGKDSKSKALEDEEVAIGAQGMVLAKEVYFHSEEHPDGILVALKIFFKKGQSLDEPETASKINNKHVVKIFGYGEIRFRLKRKEERTCYFMVMERCNSGSLYDCFQKLLIEEEDAKNRAKKADESKIDSFDFEIDQLEKIERVAYVRFRQICIGLRACHEAGLRHYDLKPSNIMIEKVTTDEWILKIGDFGFAIDQSGLDHLTFGDNSLIHDHSNLGSITAKGYGTVGFMAPEIFIKLVRDKCKRYAIDEESGRISKEDSRKFRFYKGWVNQIEGDRYYRKRWKGLENNKNKSGKKTDIFSLGFILYYLITKKRFHGWSGEDGLFDPEYQSIGRERSKLTGFSRELNDLLTEMTNFEIEKRPEIEDVFEHKWMRKMEKLLEKRPSILDDSRDDFLRSLDREPTDVEVFNELLLFEFKARISLEVEKKLDAISFQTEYFLNPPISVEGKSKETPFLEELVNGKQGSLVNYQLGYAVMKKICYLYVGYLKQLRISNGQPEFEFKYKNEMFQSSESEDLAFKLMAEETKQEKHEKLIGQMKVCLAKMKMFKKSIAEHLTEEEMKHLENQTPNQHLFLAIHQWIANYFRAEGHRQLLYYHQKELLQNLQDEELRQDLLDFKATAYKELGLHLGALLRCLRLLKLNLGYMELNYKADRDGFADLFGKELEEEIDNTKYTQWILNPVAKKEDKNFGLLRQLTRQALSKKAPQNVNSNSKSFKKKLKRAFKDNFDSGSQSSSDDSQLSSESAKGAKEDVFVFEVRFVDWMEKDKSHTVSKAVGRLKDLIPSYILAAKQEYNQLGKFGIERNERRPLKKILKEIYGVWDKE